MESIDQSLQCPSGQALHTRVCIIKRAITSEKIKIFKDIGIWISKYTIIIINNSLTLNIIDLLYNSMIK